MSASISMKKKNVGIDFLKRTTGIISGATGSYISEVMPVTTSTLSEAKSTISNVSSTFINTSQNILPKVRQLKTQMSFRGITNWFMEKEDSYGDFSGDSQLDFDIHTDPSEIAETQISEIGKNANQISQAVVSSSHKLVESQLAATANLMATADKQTAVITAGFDKTNETLNKILEVLTKNTATLIETSVAANAKRSANDDMVGRGKFNLSDYKKIVSDNGKNSQFGMLAAMVPAMLGDKEMMKQMLSPQSIVQMVIGAGINKASPNLKKNMEALDKAVNDTIMTSLIRLGENNQYGFKGQLARMFGIDSSRKETNTSRSTLELKTVPFDSIAHESLTNAIPGYLRKILVAVGGEDTVYDYRSRSFRTKSAIHKDFQNIAASKGTLYGANDKVRNTVGTDQMSNMIYDMMMAELGSRTQGGSARRTVSSLENKKDAQEYILSLLSGVDLSRQEKQAAKQFATRIGKASSGMGGIEIMDQVAKNNVNRNSRMGQYVSGANAYNVDLSDIRDSIGSDLKNIAESYGKKKRGSSSDVSVKNTGNLTGVNYTNIALYEIYRKLNQGINVFQVGNSKSRRDPYKDYGDKYLQKPQAYKVKPLTDSSSSSSSLVSSVTGSADYSNEENLLRNQQREDGTSEELTGGQRFGRWGKNRGGNLARALFSGSPEQVKDAFGLMIRDIGQVAGDGVKKGAAKINEGSGNFAGYLKHKITGAGYKYMDGDEEVVVDKNDKGGVLGYFNELIFGEGGAKGLMKKTATIGSKWFKSVAGYFNYGGKDKDEQSVAGKRKNILGTSVGAMLGMGLLGGPLGIVMGGIAGSAISQTDGIGSKIKNILFGDKDHEGDKKKDRNKRRGLIGRAVDGIVDPIRFQIGKTMTSFGSILKKNILGPLSNIGAAIKEKMSNAAGGVVSKVFGGIFKGATGMLKKLILLPLSIAKAPINAMGGLARGAAEGGGAVAGGFLNSIARGIAGKNGRAVINERIDGQKNDARIDQANSGFYGKYETDENGELVLDSKGRPKKLKGKSWKVWKEGEDARRDKMGGIDKYTSERKLTKEEIEAAEAAKKTQENTAKQAEQGARMSEDLHGLAEEGLTRGSIFTHDDGLHQRIDQLIDILSSKGGKRGKRGKHASNISGDSGDMGLISDSISKSAEENDADTFASSAVTAAASLAVSGDDVTNDESRLATSIFDEAGKRKASKNSISAKLKDLMGIQKKKSEKGEKKESIWDKIGGMVSGLLDFIKSPLGIAGLITAILGLTGNLGPVLDKLLEGGKGLVSWVTGGGEKDNAALNAVTSPFGFKTNSELNYFSPFGEMKHVNKDGGGNEITNQNATRAKNVAWRQAGIQSGRNLISAGLQYGMGLNAESLGRHGQATAHGMNMRQNLSNASGAMNSSSMRAMGSLGIRTGTGMVLGKGANYIATNLAETLGVDENTSAMIGRGTEAVTQISAMAGKGPAGYAAKKLTSSVMDDGGVLNTIAKKLIELLKMLAEKMASTKAFKTVAAPLKKLIEKFATKIGEPVLKKLGSVVTKIFARETAKAGGQAASLGIGTAIMVGGGAAIGATNAAGLFNVKSGDVDALMTTISAALGAVFDGLPFVGLVEIIDLIIAPINEGKGVRQLLAELAYKAIMGDAKLEEKQGAMTAQREAYNAKTGSKLDSAEFNDAVNEGFWKRTWHGSQVYDENGNIETYADGSMKKSGGFQGLFVGNDKKFATDANGAVLKGEDGKGIQAVDKYGNGMKEDMKWGDHVGNWASGVGRYFGGGKTYKTDANGQAMLDENNQLIVESTEKNIFGKMGDGFKAVGSSISKKVDSFLDIGSFAKDVIGANLNSIFKGEKTDIKLDEDDPSYGVKKSIFSVVKVLSSPVAAIAKVGRNVFGWFKDKVIKPVSSAGLDTANSVKAVCSGQYTIFDSQYWQAKEPSTDEPMSPVYSVVSLVGKALNAPMAMVGWVGNKVYTGLKGIVTSAGSGVEDASKDISKVTSGQMTIFNGDYWGSDQNATDNPLGVIGNISGFLTRFLSAPSAMVGYVGSKAKAGFDAIVAGAPAGIEDATEDIKKVTSGKMTIFDGDYWKTNNDGDDNPLGKIGQISGFITRLFNAPSAMVGYVGSKAVDGFKSITSGMSSIIKAGQSTIDSAKSGNISIFSDAYWKAPEVPDGSPLGGVAVVSTYIAKVMNLPLLLISEGFNCVKNLGNSIKDWWNKLWGNADTMIAESGDVTLNQGGVGGGSRNRSSIGGPVGEDRENTAPTNNSVSLANAALNVAKTATSVVTKEGGNPINVPTNISSPYGYRTLDGQVEFHKGVDLVPTNSTGDAEVGARFAGTIADVKSNIPNSHTGLNVGTNLMGNYVKIDTPSGKRVTYMHLAANSIPQNIQKGAKVSVGDKIGIMGTTGRSTGRHLHYQFNDIASGNPIDPTSSITGGSQMSSFNSVSNGVQGAEGFPDTYVDSSQSVSETGQSSNGLAGFLEAVKKAGMNFLSFITGGLISSTSQETGSTEIQYDANGMSTGTSGNMGLVDGPVEQLTTKQVAAIQSKREKKEVIDLTTGKSFFVSWAASPSYHSDWTPMTPNDVKTIWSLLHPNGGGNMNDKNDWSWNARPGVLKLNGHMVACGFHLRPHAAIMGGNPGAPFKNQSNTRPASGGWDLGGHMCMYYGDSPGGTPKCNDAAREAYVLGNKYFQAQASSLNASTSGAASGSVPGAVAGEVGIWQYLKSKGYTDNAAAGIMGCWANESNNRSDRLEGDYLSSYPGFSNVMANQSSLDNYTTGKLFPAYAKSGMSINKEAYKGTDGHYYPGVGLAQWTGPRGFELFQYAKSRGLDWRQTNGQLEFFSKEMAERKLASPLNSQGNASAAADFFCRKYEGYNQSSGISKRQSSANQILNKYKGTGSAVQLATTATSAVASSMPANAVGGPADTSEFGANNYTVKSVTPSKPKTIVNSAIKKLYTPFTSNSNDVTAYGGDYGSSGGTSGGMTDRIITLLAQVISELKSINNNTGTSSSLLDSLNGKDFVDQGLRDSITAVGKTKTKPVSRHLQGNNNNARTVAAMARP